MARDWCSMTLEQRVQHLELELRKQKPSAGADSSALLKRIGALENEIERLKPQSSSTTRTVPQYQVAKPARVDNSELDNRIKRLEQSPKQPDLSGRIARIETEIKSLSSMRSNPTQPKVALPENKDMIDRLTKAEKDISWLKKLSHVAGNYSKDTYFDDLQYSLVGQKLESPSAHITYDTTRNYIILMKTCDWDNDWLAMTIQMSHRWKTGSAVYPHVHWIQQSAAMPNLGISWLWQVNGGLSPGTSWTHVKHSANVFNWSSGNLNQITKFGTITPPTGAGLSDLLLVKIWRDVANESTLFSGAEVDANVQDNAYCASFDVHFEIDQAGSDEEYVK